MPLPIAEFKVLVAGPGDVDKELRLVEATLIKWNELHSERTGVRLKPVHWKQARPGLDEDAQASINRQIVNTCDAGIAVFGARLGSKTPRADSGTVEEIALLADSSRDVMVYFYEGKKNLREIDPGQLGKVNALKDSLKPRGLLGSYATLTDLQKQLDLHVTRLGYEFADRQAATADVVPDGTGAATLVSIVELVKALKDSLSNKQSIVTHDLITLEVERVHGALERDGNYPIGSESSPEEIEQALSAFEMLSERLMALFVEGGRWADRSNFEPWIGGLSTLCDLPQPNPHIVQPGFKINLHRYPALLGLYAGGITAVATRRYEAFAELLMGTRIRDGYGNAVPTVLAVNTYNIMENDRQKTLPSWKDRWTPFSAYLSSNDRLRSAVGAYVRGEEAFIDAFDRFEYLLGVLYWEQSGKYFKSNWAPAGVFAWRDRNRDWAPQRMPAVVSVWEELERDNESWPLLKTGLFDGSPDHFLRVARAYNDSLLTRVK